MRFLLLFSLLLSGCCRIYIRPDWPEYKPYPKKEKVRVDTVYIEKEYPLYHWEGTPNIEIKPIEPYHWDIEYDSSGNLICPEIRMVPCHNSYKVIEKGM